MTINTHLPKISISQRPTFLLFARDMDFYDLFERIEAEYENCFIFESLSVDEQLSRYSIIGFDPKHIIRARGKQIFIDDNAFDTPNPYFFLRDIMPLHILSREYVGGLVGYLNYDCINYFDDVMFVKVHPHFDQFMFGLYTDGLIFDKFTNELQYFFFQENRVTIMKKIMDKKPTPRKISLKKTEDLMPIQLYTSRLRQVKHEINAGNTFQTVLSLKTTFQVNGDTLALYGRLRNVNPSPFMYYMKFGDKKIIGASPELLFRLKNGEMETFPLAGTIKRGRKPEEDRKLARELLNNPKEIAEHRMLVDLHRNDIGKVARFGTVKVRRLMNIKRFSHVQHLSSEISGIIKPHEDMFSGLASNFPAGTLSGAPKIESMKIIDRLEDEARGPYGGAIGHFGFNGDCTFAIPIRTMFIYGNTGYTQAGSGIVHDSTAEGEYEEIRSKLEAIHSILGY